MSYISAHFAEFTWGDKIKDHKRKIDTNRLVFEIYQIWKDL